MFEVRADEEEEEDDDVVDVPFAASASCFKSNVKCWSQCFFMWFMASDNPLHFSLFRRSDSGSNVP